MVLGDAGCDAMRAGPALRAAPASPAATAGGMERISSGRQFGAGGRRRWAAGPMWLAAVRGGGFGL